MYFLESSSDPSKKKKKKEKCDQPKLDHINNLVYPAALWSYFLNVYFKISVS